MASGTVKKRMRMCGRPAVPNIRARPSEMAEMGSLTKPPGPMMAVLCLMPTAAVNSFSGLKSYRAMTIKAMNEAPPSSRQALMICTQVVAVMPPKST